MLGRLHRFRRMVLHSRSTCIMVQGFGTTCSKNTNIQNSNLHEPRKRVHEADRSLCSGSKTWGSARGKDHRTKCDGKHQGKYGKVKEEEDLKYQSDDGENLPENVVADVERTAQRERGENCPR